MKHWYLLLSAIVAAALSVYLNMTSFGGYNQTEISALFPTEITPAGITFSIWWFIYLSWFVLGVLLITDKIQIRDFSNVYLLIFAQILSSLWLIPSQSAHIALSFVIMFGILFALSLLFFNSRGESREFRWTLELFYGWILVAFLANMHQALVSMNIYFFPLALALLSLIIGALYNIFTLKKYHAPVTSLVYIWALLGIFVHMSLSDAVRFVALFLMIVLLTLVLLHHRNEISRGLHYLKSRIK